MRVDINIDGEEWAFEANQAFVPQIGEAFEIDVNGSARWLRVRRRNIVYASEAVGGTLSCVVSLIAEDALESSVGPIPVSPEKTAEPLNSVEANREQVEEPSLEAGYSIR